MNRNWTFFVHLLLIFAVLSPVWNKKRKAHHRYDSRRTTSKRFTRTVCLNSENVLRARHRTCFLRVDSGPCRADIIQWYFDARLNRCFRFFWGGCQGNGNRFETQKDCLNYCYMNNTYAPSSPPHYCQLSFDYGTCFGHFNRWGWDKWAKTCKRRLYSGCGGNQNNFETQADCMNTCLIGPSNTQKPVEVTTCIPVL